MKTQKNIQKCLLAIALAISGLVAITATSSAQTSTSPVSLPESLPIASKAMVRAYALEQVAGSRLSIFGESIMANSSSVTEMYFHPEVPTTVDEALLQMNNTIFDFKVADRSKHLGAWGELHNSIGMALFYGYTTLAVSEKGSLVYKVFNLKMNPQMPIYVGKGIESVTIKTEQQWVDVDTWGGYIFFPTDYIDKEGMLVIRYSDGYESGEIGYSLRSGAKLPLFNVNGSVGVKLEDFQSYTDLGTASNATMYINAIGYLADGHEAPVVSFTLTSTRPVRFASGIYSTNDNGSLVESPTTGWYFKKGDPTENPVNLIPQKWSEAVILSAGEYFFYPETSLYETEPPVIIGGEKGS